MKFVQDRRLRQTFESRAAGAGGGGGGGPVAWSAITGKPSTFPPILPIAQSDVTGLTVALSAKADASAVTTALAGKQDSLGFTPYNATNPAGYTANDTDANLKNRANHTGSQAISTITGLQTALDGKQAAGSYQPLSSVLTGTTASFTTALETKLNGIAAGATVNSSDASLRDRSTHTGSQASTTISDFTEAVQDVIGPMIVGAGGSYNDAAGTITLPAGGGSTKTVYSLAAAHSNNTVTPSTVGNAGGNTPWTHTLVAGKAYRFQVWGQYQSVALTTGGRMNLLGAGGLAGTVSGMMWGGIVQAAAASTLEVPIYSFANGAGSFLLTTAVNPINSPHIWGADFVFVCTTGGTLSLQWASEVAASAAQLNAGSVLLVEALN